MYRNSFRGRSNGGGRSFGSSRPPQRQFRGRGQQVSTVSESHFIKKASPLQEEIAYVAKINFADLPVPEILKQNIIKKGYTIPTPIQDETITPILEGKDVVGIANTGTGKTAAFLIPLLNKVLKNDSEKILIMVPTRELATQIYGELRSLTWGMRVYGTLVTGGAQMRNQIYELRRNPHFVIGTPGRIKDLMNKQILKLATFKTFVLDEVDRMLDMGFLPDITFILGYMPEVRHSLFFSATISPNISTLIQRFTKNPVTISVKKQDTAHNVDQDVIRVPQGQFKMNILEDLLRKDDYKKVLIFGRTKRGVDKIYINLYDKGFKVSSIHGDKPQHKRNQAIRLFKENTVTILVATDVASRGIDISDITHVINYDKPQTYEDYVHRIGRTGRGNKKGIALTFLD
jgi:superfamily II DNA/RNA helicase